MDFKSFVVICMLGFTPFCSAAQGNSKIEKRDTSNGLSIKLMKKVFLKSFLLIIILDSKKPLELALIQFLRLQTDIYISVLQAKDYLKYRQQIKKQKTTVIIKKSQALVGTMFFVSQKISAELYGLEQDKEASHNTIQKGKNSNKYNITLQTQLLLVIIMSLQHQVYRLVRRRVGLI